jgi:Raf kinase inhibitor-like YbhB/YbcL family protein
VKLISQSFSNEAMIPRRFTCDGEDLSPHLEWTGAPAATRSFVLLCDDPDAPDGVWRHWAVYDIPGDQSTLPEGVGQEKVGSRLKQAVNDFQRIGYGGPCPPRGHGSHHYRFRLLALSIDRLPVAVKPTCRDVEREARKHLIAETILIGVYGRSPASKHP